MLPALCLAEDGAKIVSETCLYDGGGQISVNVKISGNEGIVALKTKILYDKAVLSLVSVKDTELLSGKQTTDETQNPFTLRWQDSFAEVNNSANGTIAVLTFNVLPGYEGEPTITIEAVEAVKIAANTERVSVDFGNGEIIIKTPISVEITDGVAATHGVLRSSVLILCSYGSNGELIDCKIFNISADVQKNISDEIKTIGAASVKAYLWDSLQTLSPLCACAEADIRQSSVLTVTLSSSDGYPWGNSSLSIGTESNLAEYGTFKNTIPVPRPIAKTSDTYEVTVYDGDVLLTFVGDEYVNACGITITDANGITLFEKACGTLTLSGLTQTIHISN